MLGGVAGLVAGLPVGIAVTPADSLRQVSKGAMNFLHMRERSGVPHEQKLAKNDKILRDGIQLATGSRGTEP